MKKTDLEKYGNLGPKTGDYGQSMPFPYWSLSDSHPRSSSAKRQGKCLFVFSSVLHDYSGSDKTRQDKTMPLMPLAVLCHSYNLFVQQLSLVASRFVLTCHLQIPHLRPKVKHRKMRPMHPSTSSCLSNPPKATPSERHPPDHHLHMRHQGVDTAVVLARMGSLPDPEIMMTN